MNVSDDPCYIKNDGCKPELRLQLSRHGNCVMGVSD
jgi:hypothetical protein